MDPPERARAEALLAHLRQKDPADNELAFRHAQILQAVAAEPFNPKPLTQLGLLLQQAGEPQLAIDLFQQALARAHSSQARSTRPGPCMSALPRSIPRTGGTLQPRP